MAWFSLVIAGLLEIAMALALKETHGFTRHPWTAAFVVLAAASFGLLSIALRTLPVGTAYAAWTDIGAAGPAILDMLVFGESRDIGRIVSIAPIISGVIGLRLLSSD